MLLSAAPCLALNQTQSAWLEGVHFGMAFGQSLEEAILSGNNTGYNMLIQEYNDAINRTLNGDEAKNEWFALKPISGNPELPPVFGGASPQSLVPTKQPFNSSSALGKFGKQQVYNQIINPPTSPEREMDVKNAELMNFLRD